MWRWGIPASFLVHAVIAAIVLVGIPFDFPTPEKEETISVEIVPPPEEEKPPQAKPEDVPQQQGQKEPAPAEKPAEQAAAPAEKPPEPAPEQPAPAATKPDEPEHPSPQTPPENFRPVFQFGEKDTGPKRAENGESDKQDMAAADAGEDAAESGEEQSGSSPEATGESGAKNDDRNDGQSGAAVQELAVPEVGPSSSGIGSKEMPEPDQKDPKSEVAAGTAPEEKQPGGRTADPADKVVKPKSAALQQARRLYSRHATDNPIVMEALGQMSRSERGGALCNTELGEQLVRGAPSYRLWDLPKPRLGSGNVIDVQTAFSADGRWYEVGFRCEVDKDATKVVSFAYKVGGAIPKSEWRKRGLRLY